MHRPSWRTAPPPQGIADLATGAASLLADATAGSVEQGAIRGIASLGRNAALATVGSSLVRMERMGDGTASAVAVRTGLATPWGIALDPLDPRRAYLA